MNRSTFSQLNPKATKIMKSINLNFGPQHPAAHGVLRLLLQLNDEVITGGDTHIGLLHRGTEKLMEQKMYIHSLPYFDRLDYVSVLIQEHAYCLAIEKLLNTVSKTNIFIMVRTLYDELTRLLNHLLAIACHALDIGSMSPIFWGFEEREKIMGFYERVSGARMHAAFYRPNDVNTKRLSVYLLHDISAFVYNCFTTLNEINSLLLYNKIWKNRLINVGVYNLEFATKFSYTGVMLRCVGKQHDIRLNTLHTYANYSELKFSSFVSNNGDSYDRYLIRMNEMYESLFIINQVLRTLYTFQKGKYIKLDGTPAVSANPYNSMEELIHHFKYWSSGFLVPKNLVYSLVESPKGEFGVTLISDNTNTPYRSKIRSPAYFHLQGLKKMVTGHMLADLITLIGTVDIVFGEIDR